ncbi:hypothetical protein [Halegenticoccus tardaugens]|uniref:hypothetical protein n=1 Tax=Halegenticoccus tardaugens TaxID=2071624 RepID=UPI001E4D2942|nr:hypothetical protein [Halegenticoccus tardaugens]
MSTELAAEKDGVIADRDTAQRSVVATTRDRVELSVIPPSLERDAVEAEGRVGVVAYPYRVYDARAVIDRPIVPDRELNYIVSIDRSRRLAVRADVFPSVEQRTLEDVLVLPSELSPGVCDKRARKAVFRWTLRKYSINAPPEISFEQTADLYKLFWLVTRGDSDVIIDSVQGDEEPFQD